MRMLSYPHVIKFAGRTSEQHCVVQQAELLGGIPQSPSIEKMDVATENAAYHHGFSGRLLRDGDRGLDSGQQ